MKTVTTVVGTGGIVALSRWSNDKTIDARMVLGLSVLALGLAALTEANAPLAENLGTLVFVTALLLYGPTVVKGLGLSKSSSTSGQNRGKTKP